MNKIYTLQMVASHERYSTPKSWEDFLTGTAAESVGMGINCTVERL